MTNEELRVAMVERHLAKHGIVDPRVLEAFLAVPREEFVPEGLVEFAYADAPLPIGEEQTIEALRDQSRSGGAQRSCLGRTDRRWEDDRVAAHAQISPRSTVVFDRHVDGV